MTARGLAVICTLALVGCGNQFNNYTFDGQSYKHRAKGVDRRADHDFAVTVSPVSKGIAGALQAGEFAGTKYCVTTFGTSDIDWTVGPDSDPATVPVDGDTLTLTGTCIER